MSMKISDAVGQVARYAGQGFRDAAAIASAHIGAASDRWRKEPGAAALRYGYLIRHVQLARESMRTYRQLSRMDASAAAKLKSLEHLHRVILFIGYSRSGHSLVAALLDAHPNVIVSHELDAAKHLKAGQTFPEVARAVQLNSYYFNHYGRGYTGYDYTVPGQYQGRCTDLKVLGDKKANGTCRALLRDPDLVRWFEQTIPVPVTFIHVVRDPWDNIASKANRTGLSLEGAARGYLRNAAAIHVLRQRYRERMIDVYLDELSAAPVAVLRRVIGRLGLDADEKYLNDCASIVFDSPRQTQRGVDWPGDLRTRISAELRDIDHLSRFAAGDGRIL
jgi:hypothetical protein